MKYLFSILLLIALYGCGEYKHTRVMTAADSTRMRLLKNADSLGHILEIKPPAYHTIIGHGRSTFSRFVSQYGDSAAEIILAINRIDSKNLKAKDTLVVPDSITKNMLYYSPFPMAMEMLSDIPGVLFISQKIQAFAAYQYGVLVRWGPTSTGKQSTPTPNGLFHTNWKAKETISTINDEWLLKWSFNIDNFNGISIHEYAMPGYPASHSCARLLAEDAEWLYYWAKQWIVTPDQERIIAYGTPVILFGQYNFKGRKPWRDLAENPASNRISHNELVKITAPYIYKIVQRQVDRDSLAVRHSKKLGKLK